MSRFFCLALLLLAASGARGQRLYLPDDVQGAGLTALAARAGGDAAYGVGFVVSPLARVDVRAGVVAGEDRGRSVSVLVGEARYFFVADGPLRLSAALGATSLPGSDDVVARLSAGVAGRSEAGLNTFVVPRVEIAIESFSAPRIDPVPVVSGGVGVVTALGADGLQFIVESTVSYGLLTGRTGLGGSVGVSYGF